MYAATWNKEEKTCEISMIEMSDTVVYPRTMMIHLHYTSKPNTNKAIVDYTSPVLCTPVTPFPADPIFSKHSSDGMIPCAV